MDGEVSKVKWFTKARQQIYLQSVCRETCSSNAWIRQRCNGNFNAEKHCREGAGPEYQRMFGHVQGFGN